MNQILASVFIVLLFFVLTPGIYVTIPRRGSKWTVALVHGVLFALVLYIANTFIFKAYEGFATVCGIGKPCPKGYACAGASCVTTPTCTGGTLNGGCKCCMSSTNPTCPTGFTNNSGICYASGIPTSRQDISKLSKASCPSGSTMAANGTCTIQSSPSCTNPGSFDGTSMKCIA